MEPKGQTLQDTRLAWSNGDDTSEVFVPFFEVSADEVTKVRPRVLLLGSSGDLKVRAAVEYSNDGLTWTDRAGIGAAATTTEGVWQYSDVVTPSTAKRIQRYGVLCTNGTDGVPQSGQVTLAVDVQE